MQLDPEDFQQIRPIPPELGSAVVPVAAGVNGDLTIRGTAFVIHRIEDCIILATAKHVIEDLEHLENPQASILLPSTQRQPGGRDGDSDEGIVSEAISQAIAYREYSDAALIIVKRAHARETPLSTMRPLGFAKQPVGMKCIAVGYHGDGQTNGSPGLYASHGEIADVFPSGWGTNPQANFPTYRLSSFFAGGMSGGPIFNENGEVIGIVSNGLPYSDTGSQHAHGANIGLIMELDVKVPFEGQLQLVTLSQLLKDSYPFQPQGSGGNVTLERNDDGVSIQWQ